MFRTEFPDAAFVETWRSGRSLSGHWGFRASARHCLWVAIAEGELCVCPHFPFSAFTLTGLGLDYRISGMNILSVERKQMWFGATRLTIHFRNATGTDDAFEIDVHDVEAFIRGIDEIRKGQTFTLSAAEIEPSPHS